MAPEGNSEAEAAVRRYRELVYLRQVEEGIAERYGEQEMRCPVHLSVGQEAAAVGVCEPLRKSGKVDKVYSTHRSHDHYLAMGGDLRRMLSEIYGKADGSNGGRGGSMHIMDPSVGMMASIPIVASCIPLAVGAALAEKLDGGDGVAVAFLGDASIEEGVFHESANFAQLHKLPVLFVCENNLYSVYSHLDIRQPSQAVERVALAHEMPHVRLDGNDVELVLAHMRAAVERARSGGGPTFLVLDTYRWREHCGPNFDNHIGYRTEEEYQVWRAQDPVEAYKRRLIERGVMTEEEDARIWTEVNAQVDAAFDHAKAAPLPEPADAKAHVYAPGTITGAGEAA